MTQTVRQCLAAWGSPLEAEFPEGIHAFCGVLEPVTSHAMQHMRRSFHDLGELPQGQFLYLGEADISRARLLRRGGQVFRVCRCEAVSLGGRILYYWGLAATAGKERE